VVQVARAIDGVLKLGPRAREFQGDSPQRVRCVVRIRHVDIGGCLRRGFRASRRHDDGDGAARSDDSFARRRYADTNDAAYATLSRDEDDRRRGTMCGEIMCITKCMLRAMSNLVLLAQRGDGVATTHRRDALLHL